MQTDNLVRSPIVDDLTIEMCDIAVDSSTMWTLTRDLMLALDTKCASMTLK